jgi:hypothetical protein
MNTKILGSKLNKKVKLCVTEKLKNPLRKIRNK